MAVDDPTTVREIPLVSRKYPGLVALVDAIDYEWLMEFEWRASPRSRSTGSPVWYAMTEAVYMHRLITRAPKRVDVDHKDGDGLNNRRENLRLVTQRQNARNRQNLQARKTSVYLGVSRCDRRKPWLAQIGGGDIRPNGRARMYNLGRYDSEEEAARVYDEAARVYFGEFAGRLNFPEG